MPRKGDIRAWPRLGEPPMGLTYQGEQYLQWLKRRGNRPDTIQSVFMDLRLFFEWCAKRDTQDITSINAALLESYQRYVSNCRKSTGEYLTARTRAGRINTVRELCAYLIREEIILNNGAAELQLPRLPKTLPCGILTPEEIERLLKQPNTASLDGLRDKAMLELTYATGMRAVELVALDVADFDVEREAIRIRNIANGREREVPIGKRAVKWLQQYLSVTRSEWILEKPDEAALFIGMLGNRLARGYVEHCMGNYARAAGLSGGALRSLRSTVTVAMLEAGADARYAQEMFGHARLRTTMGYMRLSINKLCEVHAATHPTEIRNRARLKK